MALATYTDLKATVADFLNRTDLTSVIPTFILLAEAKIRRKLRGAVSRETLTVNTYESALPADFQEAVSLYHAGDTYRHAIELMSPDRLSEKRGQMETSGVPVYGAILNRRLFLVPAPSTDFDVQLDYYADLEALSTAATGTNWLLDDHPDVYLTGALAEAEPYLKNDERIAVWKQQFLDGLDEITLKYDRQHYGANTPAMRPLTSIG